MKKTKNKKKEKLINIKRIRYNYGTAEQEIEYLEIKCLNINDFN
jgi:hypothetical protein